MVTDPAAMRARLLRAGALPGFTGLMRDRRYDLNGMLQARDEVLRLRVFRAADGTEATHLGWKGPTTVTPEGYKGRRELEYQVQGTRANPEALVHALGFREIHRIDRQVELFSLGTAALRLEWYPRMDVLLEVEGDAEAIEAALRATGMPRSEFTADSLSSFAQRYAARTGQPAVLALDSETSELSSWKSG